MSTQTDRILLAIKEHGPLTARKIAVALDEDHNGFSSLLSKMAKRQGWVYVITEAPPLSDGNPHNGPAKIYDLTAKGKRRISEIQKSPEPATKPKPEKEPVAKPKPKPEPETIKVKPISRSARTLNQLKAEIAAREDSTVVVPADIERSERQLVRNVREKEPVQPWEFDPATDPVVKTLKNVTVSFGQNRLFKEGREHAGRLRYFASRMEVVAADPNKKTGVRVEAANTAEWLRDTANLIDELTEQSA